MKDMQVAVTGGTGTVGREVVTELSRRGHDVRVLSRRSPAHPVDLTTGEGLAAALDGVDVVVDAGNAGPRRKAAEALLVEGTRRLLVAERAAGVRHHVGISIVGIDRVPAGYYGVKLAQEAVVTASPVPWTIVRATQFHGLLDQVFRSMARFRVLPGAAVPLQPVDQGEVAFVLADTAEAEASGAITQFVGPERRSAAELARTWRLETGRRALLVPVPLAGATARALRAGALTNPGAWSGRTTFADWLRGQRTAAPPAAPAGQGLRRVA
jgi:uncharacterized protein YbjT (DUF2867 family)